MPSVKDAAESANIFVAVSGILFTIWQPPIVSAISAKIPPHLPDRKAVKALLRSVLITKTIPLSILLGGFCLSGAYTIYTIWRSYYLVGFGASIDSVSMTVSIYVLTFSVMVILFMNTMYYLYQNIRRLYRAYRELGASSPKVEKL